jgi:diketogulonate reductase-like aldo/keto reductase
MRYETIHNLQLPKIGFGTWTIGGRGEPDPALDEQSLLALRSALELGYTHLDTAENYADGHSEELIGRAIRETGVPRESLFITSKVENNHLKYEALLRACENSLRRLGMEYLDLYLIHWPPAPGMSLPEPFRALNQLVREGKVRHLGVSNFNLKLLKQSAALSETPLLTDQVPYCIPDRKYVDNGVLAYCQQNDILLTAYTPVKHRFTQSSRLKAIAQAHGVTPYQVALAWLTTQPRVITIPMSFNSQHQAENLAAADLVLSEEEMGELSAMFES